MSQRRGEKMHFAYQGDLIDCLTRATGVAPEEHAVSHWLTPESVSFLEPMRRAYVERITEGLCDKLFGPAERVFGRPVVLKALCAHFETHAPESILLACAARTLPAWIRARNTLREALLLADLLDACIQCWDALASEDPHGEPARGTEDLAAVHLSAGGRVAPPCARHDLALAWAHAHAGASDGSPSRLPDVAFASATGLLFVKSGPTHLHAVEVPFALVEFCQQLVSGASVGAALSATASQGRDDPMRAERLQMFLARLAAEGVLTTRPEADRDRETGPAKDPEDAARGARSSPLPPVIACAATPPEG